MHGIQSYVANVTGRLDRHREIITRSFETASRLASELIAADAIDVLFADAPSEVIPEWGVGGYLLGPHVMVVALDPEFAVTAQWITTTLLHEFHHAIRERGPGCGGSLAQMLVSEGLAQLFEEEVLGEAPFSIRTNISDAEIAEADASLFEQPFSQSKWFYGSDRIVRHFGYAYGYRICKAFATTAGRSAAELVAVPTEVVVSQLQRP